MKPIIAQLLILLLVFQSCTTYQKTSISLQEATGRGKVKTIDLNGYALYIDVIVEDSTGYFGIANDTRFSIDSTISRSYFLKKNSVWANEIWVELKRDFEVRGILYDVTDSSILVIDKSQREAPFYKQDYIDQKYSMNEYLAKDIIKIKLRREKLVGKTAGKGALVGSGIGFTVGLIGGINDFNFAVGLIFGAGFGAVGAVLGAITGAIAGSPKEVYHINKNIYAFKSYQIEFQDKAVLSY